MNLERRPDLHDQDSLGDQPIPDIVLDLVPGSDPELVWRNELGGLTFRIGDRFVKWNPLANGINLEREQIRLDWISIRHPAPRVLAAGVDENAQWLVTTALPGDHAVGATWRARRSEAIRAIASMSCDWNLAKVTSRNCSMHMALNPT